MSEFFAGLHSLSAWEWVGLIVLAAVIRGLPLVLIWNKSEDRSMNKRMLSEERT